MICALVKISIKRQQSFLMKNASFKRKEVEFGSKMTKKCYFFTYKIATISTSYVTMNVFWWRFRFFIKTVTALLLDNVSN